MNPISQSEINKAAWGACDTFRGVVDPSIYKDYVLTMLFVKYVSDVWKDHRARYEAEHPGAPELVDALMQQEAFVLPDGSGFDALYARRHEAGNGERIDKALHAIEEANGTKLRDVFQDISFNSNKLGDEEQKNDILRHLLEDFAKPALDLRPSRVGNLDIIGGAYEYLMSRFAASAGKKAGEFYTPAEVSELMALLVDPPPGDDICEGSIGIQNLHDAALVSPIYMILETVPEVDPMYLFRVLKTDRYRQMFAAATSASVDRRGSLRWKAFSTLRVNLPSLAKQKRINEVLATSDSEIATYEAHIEKLRSEKSALMQELLTGKSRVSVDA